MADVASKVSQIRQAVLGKDIRESMAQGIEAINTQVETITGNENSRVNAETSRVTAEENRVAAEEDRVDAESSRVIAENGRKSTEIDRQTTFNENELSRQQSFEDNETIRDTTFNTNEDTRINTFNTNETNRQSEFDTNEDTRINTFNTNENNRKNTFDTNEANRETVFKQTKTEYDTNEETRQTEFNQIKADYNTASNFNVVTYKDWSFTASETTNTFTIDMGIFNPVLDIPQLSQDGALLDEGDNYTRVGAEITLTYNLEPGDTIDVVVFKGVINDPPSSDGSNMMDGSITKMKLSDDVVEKIDKVPGLETQLNDLTKTTYKVYDASKYGNGNDADAILSAISDAVNNCGGLVITPRSTWNINKYINFPSGIDFDGCGSTFKSTADGVYTNNYMIGINSTDGSTRTIAYSTYMGSFKNVIFDNDTLNVINLKGIFVGAPYKIDNVSSIGMYQTVQKVGSYQDMVEIGRIDVGKPRGTLYHIDLGGLGDGIKIEMLHSHDWESNGNYNLLHINRCNGAKIERIINGNILVENSMAIGFASLHLERGIITIKNSAVTCENVYQWQTGTIPITIQNTGDSGNKYNKACNIKNYVIVYYADKYDKTKDYFDGQFTDTVVNIEGFYRAFQSLSDIMQTKFFGVRIAKDGTNEHEFNLQSAKNSIRSTIICDKVMQQPFIKTIQSGAQYYLSNPLYEDTTKDYGSNPAGSYFYSLQHIIDNVRMIGRSDSAERSITTTNTNSNIMLIIYGLNYTGGSFARLYKGTASGQYSSYIDIPEISGETHIDNGNGIAGFKWKTRTTGPTDSLTFFERVIFNGDLVVCHGPATPTSGAWTIGDRIINSVPTVGQPKGWICTASGTPGTWVSEGNL